MGRIVAGIPWYHKEDYEELRSVFEDGDTLHETYEEWLASAESIERQLLGEGVSVVRVNIRLTEFSRWCASHGYRLNGKARSEYASWMARKLDLQGGSV